MTSETAWNEVGPGTPLNAWLETKLEGESGTSLSLCRILCIGDDPEWIAEDGRTTVTHHSYAPPSHWRWPTVVSGPSVDDANGIKAELQKCRGDLLLAYLHIAKSHVDHIRDYEIDKARSKPS